MFTHLTQRILHLPNVNTNFQCNIYYFLKIHCSKIWLLNNLHDSQTVVECCNNRHKGLYVDNNVFRVMIEQYV